MKKNTRIVSAFPGTGKTFLCQRSCKNLIEKECWKYIGANFPHNCVEAIKDQIGKADVIFISTNKIVLDILISDGVSLIAIYPEAKLKKDYLKRYAARGDQPGFIKMMDDNWSNWIQELDERDDCLKKILKKGEYILNMFPLLLPDELPDIK